MSKIKPLTLAEREMYRQQGAEYKRQVREVEAQIPRTFEDIKALHKAMSAEIADIIIRYEKSEVRDFA